MPRNDHSEILDDKDQWWILCPNDDRRIPLEERPQKCPFCGDSLEIKFEGEKWK